MERVPIKSHPALFDRVIGYVQTGLADNLPWLNFAFGKAERLVKNYNGKRVYSPNLYAGKNEYELITPDSGIGNYCFFTLDEPEDVSWEVGDRTIVEAPFSLIVWVDMRTIEQDDERNTEAVKQDILRTLNGKLWMKEGRITINKIWEKAENIFKGFTLDEIDNQFLMQPYCGWRFEGILEAFTDCEEVVPPTPPTPTPSYIKGHIVDGSSTYSFKVNGNETINVNVNANGDWIWEVDRTITSLKEAFKAKTANLTYLELYLPNSHSLTDMSYFLYATNANNNQQYAYLQLVIKDIDTSNVVNLERAFRNSALKDVAFLNNLNTKNCKNFFNMLQCQYVTEMDLRGLDVTSSEGNTENDGISTQAEYMFCLRDIHFGNFLSNPNNNGCRPIKSSVSMLVNIDADVIRINLNISSTSALTKQSIINIINASQANLTHTLQASVYAKCASGGVWHTDIQAAIDAKAAQGYTITLISA